MAEDTDTIDAEVDDSPGTEVEPYTPHYPAEDDAVDAELVDEDDDEPDDDIIDAEIVEPEDEVGDNRGHGERPGGGPTGGGGGGGAGSGKKPRKKRERTGGGGGGGWHFSIFGGIKISLFSGNKMIDVKQPQRHSRSAPRRYASSGRK